MTLVVSRWHLKVRGVVQGVGFRPCVYRLAQTLGLAGWARNTASGVEIEVEGPEAALTDFLEGLYKHSLPLASITSIDTTDVAPRGAASFCILPSSSGKDSTSLPADIATCSRCLAEVFCPQDRRFRYPFTNCTHCGPRFTIIRLLPYDRVATAMVAFPLCQVCRAEYSDPKDRRFHAEPVACHTCGPHVWLEGSGSEEMHWSGVEAFAHAATILRQGSVLAVKGLGGFHLVCDATNEEAVRRLRDVKGRPHKPLAVMVATLDDAHSYSHISAAEAALLAGVEAPIVLVRKRQESSLASILAPGNAYLGLLLPYTPLHHLLLRETQKPLVMTSGNRRDEPLCRTAEEAKEALGGKIAAFLLHSRPIEQRCDDSVVFVTDHGVHPVRRSRGYVPLPVPVPLSAPGPILAVGAELKNTFCLLRDNEAFVSQHIGDTGSLATQRHFADALRHFQALLKVTPELLAHDLHPHYATTRYALSLGLPCFGVQHHHAHVASCLADNNIGGPAIGVVFDGTGYGPDGTIWGGEFLVADLADFRRVAHFEYLPLPGGDAAIRRPYRVALAYLTTLFETIPALPFLEHVSATEQHVIAQMIKRQVNTVFTSSCGRLFDAVAAMVGLRQEVTYEAQAAAELETAAAGAAKDQITYPFILEGEDIRIKPLFAQIVHDVQKGVPSGVIGWRFHQTITEIVRCLCSHIREREGLTTVVLSGGCWQNRLLLTATFQRLRAAGFQVYTHRQVPTNDGGISFGQAVVAAARLGKVAEY